MMMFSLCYTILKLFLSKFTKTENKMDFFFAKMFVKMEAKLIFERAIMLGIFTDGQSS